MFFKVKSYLLSKIKYTFFKKYIFYLLSKKNIYIYLIVKINITNNYNEL